MRERERERERKSGRGAVSRHMDGRLSHGPSVNVRNRHKTNNVHQTRNKVYE